MQRHRNFQRVSVKRISLSFCFIKYCIVHGVVYYCLLLFTVITHVGFPRQFLLQFFSMAVSIHPCPTLSAYIYWKSHCFFSKFPKFLEAKKKTCEKKIVWFFHFLQWQFTNFSDIKETWKNCLYFNNLNLFVYFPFSFLYTKLLEQTKYIRYPTLLLHKNAIQICCRRFSYCCCCSSRW